MYIFFGHTTLYNKIHEKTLMVITTHMYNQMNLENQKKSNRDKVPSNPDSALIKSFLNDSKNFAKTEKKIISSNS